MKNPVIGERVEIYGPDQDKFLGIGTYVGSEKQETIIGEEFKHLFPKNFTLMIPKFELGGKIIYGSECWWITVAEANRIKKKVNESKIKSHS